MQSPGVSGKIGAHRRRATIHRTQQFMQRLKTDLQDAEQMLEVSIFPTTFIRNLRLPLWFQPVCGSRKQVHTGSALILLPFLDFG